MWSADAVISPDPPGLPELVEKRRGCWEDTDRYLADTQIPRYCVRSAESKRVNPKVAIQAALHRVLGSTNSD